MRPRGNAAAAAPADAGPAIIGTDAIAPDLRDCQSLNRGDATEGTRTSFRVTLRCDPAEVRPKVDRVRRFLLRTGCEESNALECELALVEACTNAIQHVSPQGRDHPVVIDAVVADEEVEFRVTDHTAGFDWPKQPVLPDAESETGRGVFLIHALMDSVKYVRGRDENVLILRKLI
jgi:anti-sigma regulatory factor (Ser/Thr protein kinase)